MPSLGFLFNSAKIFFGSPNCSLDLEPSISVWHSAFVIRYRGGGLVAGSAAAGPWTNDGLAKARQILVQNDNPQNQTMRSSEDFNTSKARQNYLLLKEDHVFLIKKFINVP